MEHKTVLVVDDSRVSRMMITAIIKEYCSDWTIIEGGDGDEALSNCADVNNIDIIILDYNMPGMNGLELAKILIDKYPKANISLLTANIQESTQIKADVLGVGFVKKPITQEKIEGILANV